MTDAEQTPPQYYSYPPTQPKTLGVVAFIAGCVALVLSVILSVVVGNLLGPLVQPGESFAQGFQTGETSADPHAAIGGGLVVLQFLVGTGLGVWALVQGIISVRAGRGRGWGVAAIVIAVVAPILSIIVYIVVGAIAHAVAS